MTRTRREGRRRGSAGRPTDEQPYSEAVPREFAPSVTFGARPQKPALNRLSPDWASANQFEANFCRRTPNITDRVNSLGTAALVRLLICRTFYRTRLSNEREGIIRSPVGPL